MQLSMKCSVAIHCLIFIHEARGVAKVTSTLLSQSTGVNPVVIRNILSALKRAGLISVTRGTGGAELCREPEQITLYQVYSALEPQGLTSLIGIHPCSQRPCPVARKNGHGSHPAGYVRPCPVLGPRKGKFFSGTGTTRKNAFSCIPASWQNIR